MLLDICIPTYKRPAGALRAAYSALDEITQLDAEGVQILVYEDCGNSGDYHDLYVALADNPLVVLRQQPQNMGMSGNIYTMLQASSADYCVILTDDDWLIPGALGHITRAIHEIEPDIIYGPRYSYTEDGKLYTIATNTFTTDHVTRGKPLACGNLCSNFFILSGLVVKRSSINFEVWASHIDNAFFPIIFGCSALQEGIVLFLKEPLVHHTVLNVCHWEAWGATYQERHLRLAQDFFQAFSVVASTYRNPVDKMLYHIGTLMARCEHFVIGLYGCCRGRNRGSVTYFVRYGRLFLGHSANWVSLVMVPFFLGKKLLRRFAG